MACVSALRAFSAARSCFCAAAKSLCIVWIWAVDMPFIVRRADMVRADVFALAFIAIASPPS
jgi:hypothetical protein